MLAKLCVYHSDKYQNVKGFDKLHEISKKIAKNLKKMEEERERMNSESS